MSLIVHAPNVHHGGGSALLVEILLSVENSSSCTLLTDTRFNLDPVPGHIRILSFPPSIIGRFFAERALYRLAGPEDLVLCMGNLPPLLRCAGKVVVFIQNRYLVENRLLSGMPRKVRLRITIERLWLRLRLHKGVRVVVQTPSMQRAAQNALRVLPHVLPFSRMQVPSFLNSLIALEDFFILLQRINIKIT